MADKEFTSGQQLEDDMQKTEHTTRLGRILFRAVGGKSMASSTPVHSVQFYDSHEALIDRLCGVVSSGLLIGNSILMVCTREHREQLIKTLRRLDIDVRSYARKDRFSMVDADEMLAKFMVNGSPDPEMFMSSVGQLLIESKKAARSKDQGLTVFGEMVAILWEQGNKAGALALEALWNDAMKERAFHLHCAYPNWLFSGVEAERMNICEVHSHILGLAPAA